MPLQLSSLVSARFHQFHLCAQLVFCVLSLAAPAADSSSLICLVEAKCLNRHSGEVIGGAECPNRFGIEQVCWLVWCQVHQAAIGPTGLPPRVAALAQPPFVRGRSAVLHASPPGPSIFGHF